MELPTVLCALALVSPLAATAGARTQASGPLHAQEGRVAQPDSAEAGPTMVLVPAGTWRIGTDADDHALPNERPAREVTLRAFWIDTTPVTNAQFAAFVAATGYVTTAERPVDWEELRKQVPPGTPKPPEELLRAGSLVFAPPDHAIDLRDVTAWWAWTPGASWRHPEGPGSSLEGREDHPVVQVSWDDAVAYARWAKKRLPSEAEWEVAARGGWKGKLYPWGDEFRPNGAWMANTFTGEFPHHDTAADGFAGTSPVRSFPPNGYGLFDMAGNVWSWCADVWVEHAGDEPAPGEPRRVNKGGSFLCHVDYCSSYRSSARRGTPYDTGMSHIGFRCARDASPAEEGR